MFGQEFSPKLVAALLGVALVAWDCFTRRRLDYVWVYLAGTLIWGGAEFALQFSGIRQMPSHLLFGHELAPVVAQVLQGAAEGSRRDVLDVASLLFIGLLLAVILLAAWRHPWCRRRLAVMFSVMVALGAVWTVSQVLVGGRWVEVGQADGGFDRAGPVLTTVVLSLDVVFEIAVVYLPFLAVPILLGLIRAADPDRPRLPSRRHPRTLAASSNERPAP
ncbi:MAG: hypothetical protein QG597_3450 [Actinomycetota bacterium]|nr:hypothetical protein [Actinomycetota bacterium]